MVSVKVLRKTVIARSEIEDPPLSAPYVVPSVLDRLLGYRERKTFVIAVQERKFRKGTLLVRLPRLRIGKIVKKLRKTTVERYLIDHLVAVLDDVVQLHITVLYQFPVPKQLKRSALACVEIVVATTQILCAVQFADGVEYAVVRRCSVDGQRLGVAVLDRRRVGVVR